MIQINWQLPKTLFSELDKLLEAMPSPPAVAQFESVNIEEMTSGINLGNFEMIRRELTDEDLQRIVSRISVGDALTVNGQAFALYIEDRKSQHPHNDTENLPKVHLVNCGITSNKEGRFVQVINPTGRFTVIFRGGVRLERELRICKKCKYSIKSSRKGLVSKFNLQSFDGTNIDWAGWNKFIVTQPASLPKQMNSSSFVQAGTRSADSYGYTSDWTQISDQRREAADWRCECCRVRLIGRDRRFLDAHHKNRNKQDNNLENIAILCRLCHREQGFHWPDGDDHGLLVSKDWLEANRAISDRRSQQGITWRDTPAYKPA